VVDIIPPISGIKIIIFEKNDNITEIKINNCHFFDLRSSLFENEWKNMIKKNPPNNTSTAKVINE
jgi:hypothetical protein